MYYGRSYGRGGGCGGGRLIYALLIAAVSLISYFGSRQTNSVTGKTQYIDITPQQEIALGLQATPDMESQFNGEDPNQADQARVDQIGNKVVADSPASKTPYQYDFHLLADNQTVNAFALPGGQVFITRALYDKLQTDGELAGVLGHEIGHVVARHSAQQIAKAQLTQGLTGAAVLATYDPNNPSSMGTAQVAALIGQLVTLKFSRQDELEADGLGVCFMHDAGYDPNDMIKVQEILASLSRGNQPPEYLSTHPSSANRIQLIQQQIQNISSCPQ